MRGNLRGITFCRRFWMDRSATEDGPWDSLNRRALRSSIRGDHASRRGAKALKRVLFSLRLRLAQGPRLPGLLRPETRRRKRRNQAFVALALRRCYTLYPMLRDGTLYAPKTAVV